MPRLRAWLADGLVLGGVVLALSLFGVTAIAGASMEPALRAGDLVVYRRGAGSVGAGDVVLLGRPGHAFVHRVVSASPAGRLVTRGDANPIPDLEPTSAAAVRGKVLAVVPTGALVGGLAGPRR